MWMHLRNESFSGAKASAKDIVRFIVLNNYYLYLERNYKCPKTKPLPYL